MHDPLGETSVYDRGQEFAESFFAAPLPPVAVDFGAATHVGKVRSQNEDHFAILRRRRSTDVVHASLSPADLSVPESCSYAMVVADGMGGMKSGELASRLALQTMLELAGQATSWVMLLTDFESQQIQQRVEAYVHRVHAALCEHGKLDPATANMGTTWTSIHFLGHQAVVVHLGDSRAYLFRGGRLNQITRDQTMAQAMIDGGLPPEHVTKFRHILLNGLGGGHEQARATLECLDLLPGDRLLLCSDGLSDMVPDEDIAGALSRHCDPQAACDALVQAALANGGRDNVTVVSASIGARSE